MLTEAEKAACPPTARRVLARYISGGVSPEIALMHLLIAAGSLPQLIDALHRLSAAGREPLQRLAQLATDTGSTLAIAAHLVERGLIDARGADRLEATREQYDRAVAVSPEAAVALYSLGDPAILERATAELAALLADWGLLGPERDALDIGCGIGRIERALAASLRRIIGIDLSPGMIAEASRRCNDIANVELRCCNGRDLSQFAGSCFDLILAVDSFPSIVAIGGDVAGRHLWDAASLLRPGGALAIFNYSYRGDLDADRADIAAFANSAGLQVLRNGLPDLALWDGTSFLLSAPPHRG